MTESQSWQKIDRLINRSSKTKLPAYPWQELALQIIKELGIPQSKKSAVFKVCRDYSKEVIINALVDSKELAQTGLKWKYFFKILAQQKP